MGTRKTIHDRSLLDKLESLEPVRLSKSVWRVCWKGGDPLAGSTGGGRWHPEDSIEGLYTSLTEDGAIAEVHYHLSQLPVYSSSAKVLWKIKTSLFPVLDLTSDKATQLLGFSAADVLSSQQIGAAAHFLEFQGLLVPSYRWSCNNLLIFPQNSKVEEHFKSEPPPKEINWPAWIKKHTRSGRSA